MDIGKQVNETVANICDSTEENTGAILIVVEDNGKTLGTYSAACRINNFAKSARTSILGQTFLLAGVLDDEDAEVLNSILDSLCEKYDSIIKSNMNIKGQQQH